MFTDLARQAGAREPELLGRQLRLIYDGAMMSARMDGDAGTVETAKAAAEAIIDAAIG